MRKTARVAAVAAMSVLVLAGCGERGSTGDDGNGGSGSETAEDRFADFEQESHPNFKACMVSDSGGFDDKSFNETSHNGLVKAKEILGVKTGEIESNSDSEYKANIARLVKDGCNEITTVGFLLGEATLAAAKKNPKVDFAIVDFAYVDDKGNNTAPKNLKGLTYDTEQPSYLAGYLAAAESENGVVGTFGGQKIPTVTIFMDGFVKGVEAYNEETGEEVQVIGWDPEKQEGSFTNSFEDKTKGQSLAKSMIQQGADIIFPVAGPAGLGGLQAAKEEGAHGIWVDTDGCESTEYCDILLTSVVKGMDVSVLEAIRESANNEFTNELYEGTLENNGVGLADYGDDVDQDTIDKVEELKQQFIDGELTLD